MPGAKSAARRPGRKGPSVLDGILSRCAKSGDVESASQSLQSFAAIGTELKERHHVAMLQTYLKAGDLPGAEAHLASITEESTTTGSASNVSVFLFNLIIRQLAQLGNFQRARYWLGKITECGLKPNTHTFSPLINHCAEAGDLLGMKRYVDLMKCFGLKENQFTYNACLKAYSNLGDLSAAEQLIKEMRESRVPLSVVTYNSLIHTCTKAGEFATAEGYVVEMEGSGFKPNVITYNTVINACANRGDTARAETWFRRMIDKGVEPSQVTYGTVCKAFARNGLVDKVDEVMKQYEAAGYQLNEYFYASLLCACEIAKPPNRERAERAFEEMLQRGIATSSVRKHLLRVLGPRRVAQLEHGGTAKIRSNRAGDSPPPPPVSTQKDISRQRQSKKGARMEGRTSVQPQQDNLACMTATQSFSSISTGDSWHDDRKMSFQSTGSSDDATMCDAFNFDSGRTFPTNCEHPPSPTDFIDFSGAADRARIRYRSKEFVTVPTDLIGAAPWPGCSNHHGGSFPVGVCLSL